MTSKSNHTSKEKTSDKPNISSGSHVTSEVCYGCIINDLEGALKLLDVSEDVRQEVLTNVHRFMDAEFNFSHAPSYYITAVHRQLKRATGLDVPFADLRHACNDVGKILSDRLRKRLKSLPAKEGFRLAVEWAVAGNHLDFRTVGTGYSFAADEIEGMLKSKLEQGFPIDEFDTFYELTQKAKNVLYIPDNVGELAFDNIVLDYLRDFGCRTTIPYRGGAITSDATLEDFEFLNTAAHTHKIILAGPDTLGISLEEATPELTAALQNADLIITKGQANFYAMHAAKNSLPGRIVCLFTSKCDVVSMLFGLTGKVNIIKVLK
ncbi:DUF89 family protein [bacterium]|nr:DUF89 family protein [bacterium]